MDDLMAKLQDVLNDEQSMKQLGEIANMLSSEQETVSEQKQNAGDTGFAQMLSKLGLGSSGKSPPPAPENAAIPDMTKLLQLQAIMQSANKHDKNVDLLIALRPLLKKENQAKIDRLIKIFRLFAVYPALKESGLLGGDLFGLL